MTTENCTEKLQKPDDVYPIYRGKGGDEKSARLNATLGPIYLEAKAWCEANQTDCKYFLFSFFANFSPYYF
jgi:hypothetical protein